MTTLIDAPHGQKTITVEIKFWTNDLVPNGQIAKHAWAAGAVDLPANKAHGIKATTKHFYSLMDLLSKIEEVLIEQGIVLHPNDTMAKYVCDRPDSSVQR